MALSVPSESFATDPEQSCTKNKSPCLRQSLTEVQGTLGLVPFRMDHESLNSWINIDESTLASFVFEFDEAPNLGK